MVTGNKEVERIYTRGTSATSLNDAVKQGLVLHNLSSRQHLDRVTPPGIFFSCGEGSLASAEPWAIMIGDRESKLPITIQFRVNKDNFSRIAGKIYLQKQSIRMDVREEGIYIPVTEWGELREGGVVIAMWNLIPEDLIALDCMVGYGHKAGEFIYASFEELASRYSSI